MPNLKNSCNLQFIFVCLFLLCSCERQQTKRATQTGEYVYRVANENIFALAPPHANKILPYPWEESYQTKIAPISKEYFRCKGGNSHPAKSVCLGDKEKIFLDCDGLDEHSLPIKNNQEHIYPILLQLLNAVQQKLDAKVVITSGHRCLDHHLYVTEGRGSRSSKHLIGAEVTFYVENYESKMQEVIDIIKQYYCDNQVYAGAAEYIKFERWDIEKTDVSISPWYNKEIFIKLYGKNEGRDGDNMHSCPYIGIQVRYDLLAKEKVSFLHEKASKNCWRKK